MLNGRCDLGAHCRKSWLCSRFAAAEEAYSEILDIDPHDATAHLGLAIVKLRGDDLEACVAALHEVSDVLLSLLLGLSHDPSYLFSRPSRSIHET